VGERRALRGREKGKGKREESSTPDVLISESAIRRRVDELAGEISAHYAEVDELIMVGVLRGAFIFLADLSRRLTIPRRVDFIALSTYGDTTETRGAVRLVMDLRVNITGRHVLIVEDIVDSGYTLRYLRDMLTARKPASIKCCALVRKPAAGKVDVTVDYLGFDIPNVWAVGYGLDYKDKFRTLPYIGQVRSEK
jgi:hypoxanthine phosphoribosyltransferase